MKAEDINGAPQILKAALGQDSRAVNDQRVVDDREIGQQLAAVGVRRSVDDRMLLRFELVQRRCRRREARIYPADRAPIRLALTMSRAVRRPGSELDERIRNAN
jgi:hypothetical protein